MENRLNTLRYLIKSIYRQSPKSIKLYSDDKEKKFQLDYHKSEKVAGILGRSYYFGTEIKYETHQEYLKTFKQLLQVKRALKKITESKVSYIVKRRYKNESNI